MIVMKNEVWNKNISKCKSLQTLLFNIHLSIFHSKNKENLPLVEDWSCVFVDLIPRWLQFPWFDFFVVVSLIKISP